MSEQVQELSQEELKEIISRALKAPKEAEYLLTLETFHSSNESDDFDVIYGDAEIVELEYRKDSYGQTMGKYVIIPKTKPVIVERTISGDNPATILYVFTKDGWRGITVE